MFVYIENSKGTTVLDRNFVQVYPGVQPQTSLDNVGVVPNPYIVRSDYKESEYLRQIRFTNLPNECTISIYTVTGEFVFEFQHVSLTSGNAWWDMRTINNQEVSPGLYLYYVKQINHTVPGANTTVGKFAVIR